MNIALPISSDVGLDSVDIWSNLVHISWHLLLDLATSNFIWVILASFAILDVPHLLSHDFLVISSPWVSWYLGCIFFLPYIQSCPISMIICLSFPMLGSLLVPWCYSSSSLSVFLFCLLLLFSSAWLLLPLFSLTIILSWVIEHLCYSSSCLLDLFLTICLPLCLSSLEYAVEWSHSPVASNTIWPVIHLTCEVLWDISSSCGLSRSQIVLLYLVDIVSILLRLLWLPVVPCHKFCSFFLLVALFLIRMLLVSISLLALGTVLLQLYVLKCPFPL